MANLSSREIAERIRSDITINIDGKAVSRDIFGPLQWRLKLATLLFKAASRVLRVEVISEIEVG